MPRQQLDADRVRTRRRIGDQAKRGKAEHRRAGVAPPRGYRSLADIERGFRVLKSDIEIAPVYRRLPDRIRTHALICFLALVLHRVMRMRLKAHGNTHSPKTTLELLRRLQKHRVQLGNQQLTGIGRISAQQLELFAALDIKNPA